MMIIIVVSFGGERPFFANVCHTGLGEDVLGSPHGYTRRSSNRGGAHFDYEGGCQSSSSEA